MEKEIKVLENDFINQVDSFIQNAISSANSAVSSIIVSTYWNIGKSIVVQEQKGEDRASYGEKIIELLSERLVRKYDNSYNKRNLQYFRKFYLNFKDFENVNTCVHNLTWSHFRRLLSVESGTCK